MSQNPRLPQGVPPEVVQGLLGQILQGQAGPGPMPPAPGQPDQASMPGPGAAPALPPGMLPPHPSTQPPPGGPLPGESPDGEGRGLSPSQIAELQDILRDPKAKREVEKIIKAMGGRERIGALSVIDPRLKTIISQEWNARKRMMAKQLTEQRGLSPGASEASDEALLTVYYTTPKNIKLEDIPDYANVVRVALMARGVSNVDDLEDQVMRECFPLRESVIRNGRPFWQERVDFVRDMRALTDRWIKKYGDLPRPDWAVQEATKVGHGDPESQPRDADSEAVPPGDKSMVRGSQGRSRS